MTDVLFLYATAPSEKIATEIARSLVESGAAACVNIIPGMKSCYRWRGRIETADETVMIVKTTAGAAVRARELIVERHPYDTPAIAALEIEESLSSKTFCDWIREATGETIR